MIWQKDELLAKDLKYRLFVKNEPFAQVISSERKIAKKYNFSRNTVRKALSNLVDQNILRLHKHSYILNQANYDPIYRDLNLLPQDKSMIFALTEQKSLEANKEFASRLGLLLGAKITCFAYYYSFLMNKVVPFAYNYLYVPGDVSIGRFKNKSPLRQYSAFIKWHKLTESQTIKLKHPSKSSQFYLDLPSDSFVIKRVSLFATDRIRFLLLSEIIPKYAVIFNPNRKILQKVDGFVE